MAQGYCGLAVADNPFGYQAYSSSLLLYSIMHFRLVQA